MYLEQFISLEVLQLPLEAEVGIGNCSSSSDHLQSLLPVERSHAHDVGHCHRNTAGHPGQTIQIKKKSSIKKTLTMESTHSKPFPKPNQKIKTALFTRKLKLCIRIDKDFKTRTRKSRRTSKAAIKRVPPPRWIFNPLVCIDLDNSERCNMESRTCRATEACMSSRSRWNVAAKVARCRRRWEFSESRADCGMQWWFFFNFFRFFFESWTYIGS